MMQNKQQFGEECVVVMMLSHARSSASPGLLSGSGLQLGFSIIGA